MNKVFIATSLDGFIADANGSVEFLYQYPDIPGEDMGYATFMATIDALLMGRKTLETVLGFGVEWPYQKPVFVWTTQLKSVPENLDGKVYLVQGTPAGISAHLKALGYQQIYIDGGKTIQAFLNEDLIDEMTITTVPVLLGSGIPLFGELSEMRFFTAIGGKNYPNGVTQRTYIRDRERV